ncbi:MAG: hypothetical protein ACE5IY_11905 [bacterium]
MENEWFDKIHSESVIDHYRRQVSHPEGRQVAIFVIDNFSACALFLSQWWENQHAINHTISPSNENTP